MSKLQGAPEERNVYCTGREIRSSSSGAACDQRQSGELNHAGPLDLGLVCGRVTINISLLRSSMNLAMPDPRGASPTKCPNSSGAPGRPTAFLESRRRDSKAAQQAARFQPGAESARSMPADALGPRSPKKPRSVRLAELLYRRASFCYG